MKKIDSTPCRRILPRRQTGALARLGLAAALGLAACATHGPWPAAVADAGRPAEDRVRDADRRPAEVLAFFGIGEGDRVAEMMSGRGYYAEILARGVGPTGRVYVQNTPFVLERFAEGPLSERLARIGGTHVVRLDRPLEDPGLPPGGLDAVLMVLFYHDTHWQGVDRGRMNQAVLDALVPGGVYGIVDHHAEAGSGDRDVKTLHRIDRAMVVAELLEAGFVLDAESQLLRHPEDDRTRNVFDEAIRGRTDRFVLRFRKPD